MKQHAFLLVNGDFEAALAPLLARPTGEFVEVLDNDGNPIEVEVLVGGYAQVGLVDTWNALLTASTDAGYTALFTGAAESVIELVRLTDVDFGPTWPEMATAPASARLSAVNTWLSAHAFPSVNPSTNYDFVNAVFGLFQADFDAYSSVYVN